MEASLVRKSGGQLRFGGVAGQVQPWVVPLFFKKLRFSYRAKGSTLLPGLVPWKLGELTDRDRIWRSGQIAEVHRNIIARTGENPSPSRDQGRGGHRNEGRGGVPKQGEGWGIEPRGGVGYRAKGRGGVPSTLHRPPLYHRCLHPHPPPHHRPQRPRRSRKALGPGPRPHWGRGPGASPIRGPPPR